MAALSRTNQTAVKSVWISDLLCCPLQSIMKNYDQNQDGYISLEDFEKIAANFPFSFCTHETDR